MIQTLTRHLADTLATAAVAYLAWDSICYGARAYATDRPFIVRAALTTGGALFVLGAIWL